MKPLGPLDTTELFVPLHDELLILLRGLDPDDWERPTVAGRWRVRDVAAHLLDGDLRTLSMLRDGHRIEPAEPIGGYTDLVGFLNRLNAEWVEASRRLSPSVLAELLAVTGPEVAATFAALPPDGASLLPVAWAGEEGAKNWMHVGREYTERWHHQMQIRDAVGAPGLLQPRWLVPLLDLSVRALPAAYRSVGVAVGTTIVVEVEGGGAWSLVEQAGGWAIFGGAAATPDAVIRLDPETAWRSLYHALPPDVARSRARLTGPEALTAPFFEARSVMV